MTTYLFSALADGAAIDFDARADTFVFDAPALSAASLSFDWSAAGSGTLLLGAGGKSVALHGVQPFALDALRFADGSRVVASGLANGFSNSLAGTAGADALHGSLRWADDAPVRVSQTAAGRAGDEETFGVALSADGRFVLLSSRAGDLVPGDGNRAGDAFVHDLATGVLTRASTSGSGGEGAGGNYGATSFPTGLSADGRYVTFLSDAPNLVPGDTNNDRDVFVKDMLSGALTLVSGTAAGAVGNGFSNSPSISGDGRLVAFTSQATNLGVPNGSTHVLVKNLAGGAILDVTPNAAGAAVFDPVLSADGRHVVFTSSASLLFEDGNAAGDVYIADLHSFGSNAPPTLRLVSTTSAGAQGNGDSGAGAAAVSANGRHVAFSSLAANLVAGDTNASYDVYLKDLSSGELRRVSLGSAGGQGAGHSLAPSLSGDGRYVAFVSLADGLVADDANGLPDAFVKDMATGELRRVGDGAQAVRVSADGRTLVYSTSGTEGLAGDDNGKLDAFVVANPFLVTTTLAGGAGNDTYWVRGSGDVVVELVNAGTDTVKSSVSYTLTVNVEHLVLLGSAALDGTGNAAANVLTGNAGDNRLDGGAGTDTASYAAADAAVSVALGEDGAQDTGAGRDTLIAIENLTGGAHDDVLLGDGGANVLDGGAGADVLAGGLGNDTYVVDRAGDVLLDDGGIDSVRASVSWTLAPGYEHLLLLGAANLNATGNGSANVITGNAGSNRLDGGTGIDTVSYAGSRVGVVVSLDRTLQATRAGNDTLLNFENATGGSFNDTLHGSVAGNVLDGGAGTDTLSYARAGAAVTVDLAVTATQATGGAGADRVLGFEHLVGSAFADTLSGDGGANRIDGGAGNDRLSGRQGNDTYVVDSTGDVIVEAAGGGTDSVLASLSWTLGAELERLTLLGSANIDGTGNALANVLTGNAGNNVLHGGAGSDTVTYAAATGAVAANLASGVVSGAAGADTLLQIEHLAGSAFDDTLVGSAASNTLTGGAGSDRLTSGAGSDVIVLSSLLGADTLTDHAPGVDVLRVVQSALPVGDGNTSRSVLVTVAPNNVAPGYEVVIATADIAGALTAQASASAIGSATAPWLKGETRLFVVDNGTDSALWYFKSLDGDTIVDTPELTLLATLTGTTGLGLADIQFV